MLERQTTGEDKMVSSRAGWTATSEDRRASSSARRGVMAGMGVLGVSLFGCVLPDDDPTGVELSWRFLETNVVDGEDGQRVRTCAGANIGELAVEVVDRDSPERRGKFRFDCETGFQTEGQFQTEASNVFIALHPGEYVLTSYADENEWVGENIIDVSGRGLSFANLVLQRSPFTWDLSVAGLETCETFSLRLQYADPGNHLVLPPPPADDDEDDEDDDGGTAGENSEVMDLLYRNALLSDRDLSLSGESHACGDAFAGAHRFGGIDPGNYDLIVTVDGESCTRPIALPEQNPLALDLEGRPCSG